MLSNEQINNYHQHGFLHIPNIFDDSQVNQMNQELARLIQEWSVEDQGWTGPWRDVYMDEETNQKSTLILLQDLQLYSQAWLEAVTHKKLVEAMASLIGPNVEFEHTTLHAKPPGSGQPFPMHQDWAFYEHADDRYVDVLIHLDDTNDENGCIRFLDGSHKKGSLSHITESIDGPCTPHLPTEQYSLEDTVAVPAKAGDIVCFNINTIHGSRINQTSNIRRMVRAGYRHPENIQRGGRTLGRPGLMVKGFRKRLPGQEMFYNSVLTEIQTTTV